RLDLAVRGARLFECAVGGQRDDALERGAVALEPIEVELGQLDGRDLVGPDQLGEACDGPERDFFERGRPGHAFASPAERAAPAPWPVRGRLDPGRYFDARDDGVEAERRRDRVRQLDLP